MKIFFALLAALAAGLFPADTARAQILASSGTYSQNFDSLANTGSPSWTDNVTLPGWYVSKAGGTSGNGPVTSYTPGTGSSGTGAIYSFGASGSTERALGSIASGTPGNFAYGVRFTNDTGSAQSNITVSYTGEQWRDASGGGAVMNMLAFSYQVSSAPLTNSDAGNSQTWINFTALNFDSPVVDVGGNGMALDGNVAPNRQVFTNIVLTGAMVQPGQELFLRWGDINDAGNDAGIAVDNLTVSFSSTNSPTSNTPPSITMQPQSQTVNSGDTVTFTVAASGTAPLSYQWQSNNVSVAGATNSAFTLAGMTTNLTGSAYFVTITNSAGSTNSRTATLTVNSPASTNSPPAAPVQTRILRIVSYNIDCADQNSDSNIIGPAHSLPTVVQAIGMHHIGANAQPVDVMSVEELSATTLSNFVAQLNAIYGAGTYAFDPTTDPNTGGGPDGLIYKTNTVLVVSARALLTGQAVLLQSNGTYTAAHSPGGGVNGVVRAPMVYQLRPAGFGAADDFYFCVSHARSTSDDSAGDARYAEAQEVRSDAKYNLPAGAHIIYGGDWNLFNGSGENAYKCLTGQVTSDGINWSDGSAIWANTNQTQACDPMSTTTPPTTATWGNVPGDNAGYLYGDSTVSLTSRIDIQMPNALMFGVYNSKGGVQLATDTADPFDTSNFPSTQYPYAFETFGNNGSTPQGSSATSAGNHSLNDLTNTVPNAATVYADLLLSGSGSSFSGSDHYPIVGDYTIPVPAPVITGFRLAGTNLVLNVANCITGGVFTVLMSMNISLPLTNWTALAITSTATGGSFTLTATNAVNPAAPGRFYLLQEK